MKSPITKAGIKTAAAAKKLAQELTGNYHVGPFKVTLGGRVLVAPILTFLSLVPTHLATPYTIVFFVY